MVKRKRKGKERKGDVGEWNNKLWKDIWVDVILKGIDKYLISIWNDMEYVGIVYVCVIVVFCIGLGI